MGYKNNYGVISQWYKTLPHEKKLVVRDIFVELLKEKDCVVNSINDLHVDWEFNVTHKHVQRILKDTRGRATYKNVTSRNELTSLELQLIKKKEHIESDRMQSKALARAIRVIGVEV
jgi:hypothetical protein